MSHATNPFMDQGRSTFLQTRVNATPQRKGLLAAWPRETRELPSVELDVDWVRFSTLNHRTKAEQLREIARATQPDLFSGDPLGKAAQDAQYRILIDQAGFDELKADLAERRQQEPAVITADGVLINGNRRAAALRSLLHDENNLDGRYIRCLVLPEDATPAEIIRLEAELQVAKDFKEAYSWVNQALLIEELYNDNGRKFEIVAAMMHRQVKDIISDYEKIQQVNQLVDLSNGRWLHVDFEPNESAFDELAQYIRNKNDDEKDLVRSVYFLGTLTGVNYRELRHLRRPDCQTLVEAELRGDLLIAPLLQLSANATPRPNDQQDQLLDSVLGDGRPTGIVGQLLDFLATHDRSQPIKFGDGSQVAAKDVTDQIARAVQKAALEAEEQKKDLTMLTAPTTRLEQAIKNIERARDILDRSRALPGWNEAAFSALVTKAKEVLGEIKPATK
ncbi:ParB N-terminal domain-containing protein [Horticoccus sp. 23ND18S-11]|uniref:hypothetical protein n=1 Tax=Horticoccus sp. 23ND18S-11 TaxID=3391832 RepID=UPI0039C9AC53